MGAKERVWCNRHRQQSRRGAKFGGEINLLNGKKKLFSELSIFYIEWSTRKFVKYIKVEMKV